MLKKIILFIFFACKSITNFKLNSAFNFLHLITCEVVLMVLTLILVFDKFLDLDSSEE